MSDFDGDLLFTTSNKNIIKGRTGGKPITYEKRIAEKEILDESNFYKTDMLAMNSKVGYVTNITSTYHCMLEDFKNSPKEYEEIQKRLKILRQLQGEVIDSAKNGGVMKSVPQEWVKYSHIDENLDEQEKERLKFNNSLIVEKRPKFMIWLYSHYQREYKRKMFDYDEWSADFGYFVFFDLLKKEKDGNLSVEEQRVIKSYRRWFPYISNNSTMNKVEKYLLENLKFRKKKVQGDFNPEVYYLPTKYINKTLIPDIEKIHTKYMSLKKQTHGEADSSSKIELLSSALKNDLYLLSIDVNELLDTLVYYIYEYKKVPSDFLWNLFGDEVVFRLEEKFQRKIVFPIKDKDGDFEYLWSRYKFKEVSLDEIE